MKASQSDLRGSLRYSRDFSQLIFYKQSLSNAVENSGLVKILLNIVILKIVMLKTFE